MAALPPGGVSPHYSVKSSALPPAPAPLGHAAAGRSPRVLALSSTSSSTGREKEEQESNPIIGLGRDPKTEN